MGEYIKYIQSILDQYKCKDKENYLIQLPVHDKNKEIVAYLRPVTQDYEATIINCVELFSQWRIENPTISTGTFQVTNERTRKWLDKFVINNPDRIIFMIVDFNGKFLGHIGLASFEEETKTAEIDSVLRGVKDVCPGLMEYAMKTIINWGIKELDLKNIILKVYSDNERAVKFYERCDFTEKYKIPLVKVILPDEEKWEICEDLSKDDAEKYYLVMKYVGKDD